MNGLLRMKWIAGMASAYLLAALPGAHAREVMVFPAGQIPDPAQLASIFSRTPNREPVLKTRGIRLLVTAGTVVSTGVKEASQLHAHLSDCPDSFTQGSEDEVGLEDKQSPSLKIRGVRRPSGYPQEKHPAHRPVEEMAVADCPSLGATATESPPAGMQEEPEMGSTHATESGISDSIALLVPFQFNSAQIMPDATPQLDALAEGIKMAGPSIKLIIEGHTDARGGDQYNVVLSFLRASAVKNYLVKVHQIAPENLTVMGMGKRMPLNATDPYAPENRRVEFRIKET